MKNVQHKRCVRTDNETSKELKAIDNNLCDGWLGLNVCLHLAGPKGDQMYVEYM